MWYNIRAVRENPLTNTFSKRKEKLMKYTVTVNEKSKTVTVNLNGYEGVAKCCTTDTFNLQTGIELALERARVAKANAEAKKNSVAKSGDVMELVKALEKALPKGQMVIVGNGNELSKSQKEWLHSFTDCKGDCECDCCDCDDCELRYTEEDLDRAYNEGYEDGHSDGYDEGCEEGLDEDEVLEAVRNALHQ
jgi:hypothetical protein